MRTIKLSTIAFSCMLFIIFFVQIRIGFTQKNIYKSGKIKFKKIFKIDQTKSEDAILVSPYAIISDKSGNIYISDYKSHSVKVFDNNGKYLRTIGRKGSGPGDLLKPTLIEISDDKLYIMDNGNFRICIFSLEGKFLCAKKFLPYKGRIEKIRALPNGDMVIGFIKSSFESLDNPQTCSLKLYSKDLELKKGIFSCELYLQKYITEPVFTNRPIPFSEKLYWGISPDGKIITGLSKKYSINIFNSQGELIHKFKHSYKPVKINKLDKLKFLNSISIFSTNIPGSRKLTSKKKKEFDFPKYKPAFSNLLIDQDGSVLISIYNQDRTKDCFYFDVFNSKGEFINQVEIEGKTPFPRLKWTKISNGFLYLRYEDDDYMQITKYKMIKSEKGEEK